MRLLVTDANIFIDLVHLGVIEAFFRLPFEIHTSDIVWDEISAHHPAFEGMSVHVHSVEPDEMKTFLRLNEHYPGLGMADCSVIYFSELLQGICLTGDGTLRKIVQTRGQEVHGILFVVKQFAECRIYTFTECGDILQQLKRINPRLPKTEIDKLLASLEAGGF